MFSFADTTSVWSIQTRNVVNYENIFDREKSNNKNTNINDNANANNNSTENEMCVQHKNWEINK